MQSFAAVLVIFVGVVACNDEIWMNLMSAQLDEAIAESGYYDVEASLNIPALAGKLGESTLVELVKDAGLADALSGTGPFTVFGPTNAAFDNLPKPFFDLLKKNTTLLKDILTYHVASGQVLSKDLQDNMMVKTLQGKTIRINFYKNNTVITASGRRVTVADQMATNGVIHVVSGVLLPPAGSVTAVVSKCPAFSTLLKAVSVAGLATTLDGAGPFTVFAPTNKAFAKIPPKCLAKILADKALLTDILTYHVVSGVDYSAGLSDGQEVTTLEGKTVKITLGPKKVLVNKSTVIYADATVTNGVIHAIDTVLIPHGVEPCDDLKAVDAEEHFWRLLNKELL